MRLPAEGKGPVVTALINSLRSRTTVPPERGRYRTSGRQDVLTVVFAAWLVFGVFVDGWAHTNLGDLESFFTPWHGLLYSGFGASAAWIGWLVMKGQEAGHRGVDAFPEGYGVAAIGAAVFGTAGLVDMVWHTLLGIEIGAEALYSPPHLALFVGALLLGTSPLRAHLELRGERAPWVAIASMTVLLAAVSFFLIQMSGFLMWGPTEASREWIASQRAGGDFPHAAYMDRLAIASVLISSTMMMAPVLFLVRRWRLPFGAVAVMWTVPVALLTSVEEFEQWPGVLAALAAGLVADTLVHRLRPSGSRVGAFLLTGLLLPVGLWLAEFAALGLQLGLAWSPELWGGTTTLAALGGAGLALLMRPDAATSS